jgi:hypothetical protein
MWRKCHVGRLGRVWVLTRVRLNPDRPCFPTTIRTWPYATGQRRGRSIPYPGENAHAESFLARFSTNGRTRSRLPAGLRSAWGFCPQAATSDQGHLSHIRFANLLFGQIDLQIYFSSGFSLPGCRGRARRGTLCDPSHPFFLCRVKPSTDPSPVRTPLLAPLRTVPDEDGLASGLRVVERTAL